MKNEDNFFQLADAHVFYGTCTNRPDPNSSLDVMEEYNWRQSVIKTAQNGDLLLNNSFFNDLKKNRTIYLAHTTFNLKDILDRGTLYASGGCLVGSIYCVPLTKDNNGLRLHNLGKYIREVEAPISSRNTKERLNTIIFEVKLPDNSRNNLIGIDYLRLGKIHFSIYKELEYLLSSQERYNLYKLVVNRARRSINFLSTCHNYYFYKDEINYLSFLNLFIKTIDNLPILGYIYFEVIAEYLMLYQDNKLSQLYRSMGEFYNATYKDLMFGVNSSMSENFKLSSYKPTFKEIISYLEKNKVFNNLDKAHLLKSIVDRLIFVTNARLFNLNDAPIHWCRMKWDFESLVQKAEPLVGHIIHRELRTFGRYPDFYFYFDQNKALQVWNYWNHMDITTPFNGIIPKGEVGINPAFSDLKYKVYNSEISYKDNLCYLEPTKELRINLVPKLVDLKFTFMRNKMKL